MTDYRIPLFKVHMPSSALTRVSDVLSSGYIGEGPVSQEFEFQFGKWINNPNIAVVNSGTSAIILALRIAGVGYGTEVISTPMTCLATNAAVAALGATVRWADIDPTTGNINPQTIAPMVSENTKAILFVDWAGMPANLYELNDVASELNLSLIQDAAHSLGASYDIKLIGNHCDFVCFSFQAIKNLTTVDGGAVACLKETDSEEARRLRWYGLNRQYGRVSMEQEHDVSSIGYKMHLNDVLASIGLEQLHSLSIRLDSQRRNAERIKTALDTLDGINFQQGNDVSIPSYWVLNLQFESPDDRKRVMEALARNSVQSSVVHQRNDLYSAFRYARRHLPGVDKFASTQLSIPCGWWLSEDDCDVVSSIVSMVMGGG